MTSAWIIVPTFCEVENLAPLLERSSPPSPPATRRSTRPCWSYDDAFAGRHGALAGALARTRAVAAGPHRKSKGGLAGATSRLPPRARGRSRPRRAARHQPLARPGRHPAPDRRRPTMAPTSSSARATRRRQDAGLERRTAAAVGGGGLRRGGARPGRQRPHRRPEVPDRARPARRRPRRPVQPGDAFQIELTYEAVVAGSRRRGSDRLPRARAGRSKMSAVRARGALAVPLLRCGRATRARVASSTSTCRRTTRRSTPRRPDEDSRCMSGSAPRDDPRGLDRGARSDRALPAAAGSPRPRPREPGRDPDRRDAVHQPRQRLPHGTHSGCLSSCRDRVSHQFVTWS